MKKALGIAVVLILVVGLFIWRSTRTSEPASDAASAARAELGRCDQQPRPPQLPAALSPASNDISAIVAALDSALTDQHKAWLRCFTLDDELLAETQNGLGRWLRTVLRLRQPAALAALGAAAPTEASSLIILVYAAHLRGHELSLADARSRRLEALAEGGVRQ